jgi:ABC-type dipeptide/oligopeptide/nickel transport system permease component
MVGFILKRLGFALVTALAVLTLVFFAIRILPGDPALVILGDQASAVSIAALRTKLGLDQPMLVQYYHFISGLPKGDWGISLATGRPVVDEILNVLPSTIELTAVSLLLGILIGVPAGVWAAVHRNKLPDYLTRVLSLLGLSAPAFVSGVILLLIFSVSFGWLPVIGGAGASTLQQRIVNLVLPAINLGLIMAAYITRVTRSAMLEVLSQDYIRTAMAKGLSAHVVTYRHAFRNCLIPVVTVVGLYFGILLGNSVLTEIVFSRPGLGKLIVGALAQRDYSMLQGMIVIYTLIVVTVNLITDLSYGFIDPRVSTR